MPDLTSSGFRFLEADNGSGDGTTDRITFFYQQPGTTTKYVTYAGYVRNRAEAPAETMLSETRDTLVTAITRRKLLERALFVFGEPTSNSAVPKTGTGTYSGEMLASMVNNPDFENGDLTYYQWIHGKADVAVDFGAGTVATTLSGTTGGPLVDASPILPTTNGGAVTSSAIPAGATFTASSTGRIDLVGTGGFTGTFSEARFTAGTKVQDVTIAGSTLDGAFYGPAAEEVGATFRIVGGVPDQRVDIIGALTGVKK